jgi:hypothetical protein
MTKLATTGKITLRKTSKITNEYNIGIENDIKKGYKYTNNSCSNKYKMML